MDYTVHGILQGRILEGVAAPSPGDLPNPGIEPRSPSLQAGSLPAEPPGKTNCLKAAIKWKYNFFKVSESRGLVCIVSQGPFLFCVSMISKQNKTKHKQKLGTGKGSRMPGRQLSVPFLQAKQN